MEKRVLKVDGIAKEINIYSEEEIDNFEDSFLDNTLDLIKEFDEIGNEYE